MTSLIEVEEDQSTGSLWSPIGRPPLLLVCRELSSDLARVSSREWISATARSFSTGAKTVSRRVTTPYCPHMGANLSVGQVVGNDLQCAFHHWRFGPDGHCTVIPSGIASPDCQCLCLSRRREMGIHLGLLRREPLYPVPSFPDWDEDKYVWRTFKVPLSEPLLVIRGSLAQTSSIFSTFKSSTGFLV